MVKDIRKKIIIGGLLVGGLVGLAQTCEDGCPQQKHATQESGYFTDKGLIYHISSIEADNNISLAVGDMDSDGDLDVLIGKSQGMDRGVAYFENIGNGQYLDKGLIYHISSIEADNNISLAVGDMDSDGDLDVLIGKSQGMDRGVAYFENNMPQKNKK